MPRVLLLTSHPVDGRDGADKEMAVALAQGLPQVRFTHFGRMGRPAVAPGRRVPILSRRGSPTRLERAQVALGAPLLARSADLVHVVMTIGPTFAAWTRSRLSPRRGPVLLTVPGIVGPECLEGSRPLGVTVTLSAHTAGMLRAAGHPDVRVVPPGIDLTRWPRLPRRERSRPTVFFAGHAGRHGGTRQAIDVAARVQRGGTPVRLVLALRIRPGQDEATELAVARAAAGAQGLDDVNVHGQLDSMPEALADADVVVFTPERFDGGKADLPLVVLEAMATGRPVVATRFPQLAALGDVVELTAAGDADAAAGAVRALLTDPARWAERASRGRDAVETRFAAPQMCRAYAEIYAELLSRPGVGAGGP